MITTQIRIVTATIVLVSGCFALGAMNSGKAHAANSEAVADYACTEVPGPNNDICNPIVASEWILSTSDSGWVGGGRTITVVAMPGHTFSDGTSIRRFRFHDAGTADQFPKASPVPQPTQLQPNQQNGSANNPADPRIVVVPRQTTIVESTAPSAKAKPGMSVSETPQPSASASSSAVATSTAATRTPTPTPTPAAAAPPQKNAGADVISVPQKAAFQSGSAAVDPLNPRAALVGSLLVLAIGAPAAFVLMVLRPRAY